MLSHRRPITQDDEIVPGSGRQVDGVPKPDLDPVVHLDLDVLPAPRVNVSIRDLDPERGHLVVRHPVAVAPGDAVPSPRHHGIVVDGGRDVYGAGDAVPVGQGDGEEGGGGGDALAAGAARLQGELVDVDCEIRNASWIRVMLTVPANRIFDNVL